jgi:hypothetical protein
MVSRNNLLKLLAVLVVLAVFLTSCDALPPDLELPTREPGAEEPAPTEPPAEPEATEPPAEPEPTQPPAEEPEATEPPAEPPPEEPPAEPAPPAEGGSGTLGILVIFGIVGVVGLAIIAIVVVLLTRPGKGAEEAPAQVPSVPITTLAEDIKGGRISKVVVSGENLTITRTDGLVLVSHKEPTADLVQLLTNLGVTSEMLSEIIIEVETPEIPID